MHTPASLTATVQRVTGVNEQLLPRMPLNPAINVHMSTGFVFPAGSILRFVVFNSTPSGGSQVVELGWCGYLVSSAVGSVDAVQGPMLGMTVHPNPSTGSAEVEFVLSRAVTVGLSIFDARGRRVARMPRERLSAGRHVLLWDGRSSSGALSPPGVYVARLEGDGIKGSKPLVVRR